MAETDQCKWWLDLTEEGNIFITRKKNGQQINIRVEGMTAGSSPNVVMVKTVYKTGILVKKPFDLNDFERKQNDLSGSMSDYLESSTAFVDQWMTIKNQKQNSSYPVGNVCETEKEVENEVTDACDMDAINRKRVKFGDDYILEVPVRLLSSPPQQRAVRELSQTHVLDLKKSFSKHRTKIVFNTLAVHIPNVFPVHVNKENMLNGKFALEVLGGNHTRQALMDTDQNLNIPVMVYAGLSNDQALVIGYEHNLINKKSRLMTFREDVLLFRRKLVGNPNETLSQPQRTEWRKKMAHILGIKVVEVRKKYRVHSWLAGQPDELWNLISQFMAAWDAQTLKDQRPVPLKPHHMSFLKEMDPNEALTTLRKLLNKDISHQEVKMKPQPSAPKRQLDISDLETLRKEVMEEKIKLRKWEEDLRRREKLLQQREGKQIEDNDIKEHNTDDLIMEIDTEPQEESFVNTTQSNITETDEAAASDKSHHTVSNQLHMPLGGVFTQGEWIAVHYPQYKMPPVGLVLNIVDTNSAEVHFLKKSKMSKSDIQNVHKEFVICKVDVKHDTDKDEFIVPESAKVKLEKNKKIFLQRK